MHQEIENVGVQLGRRIIDVMTKDQLNVHQTQLEIIKFICVSFWPYLFGKQVDNLKTNNAGTFVLLDQNFKFLGRISSEYRQPGSSGEEADPSLGFQAAVDRQRTYSYYVVGLIKGALKNLGTALGGKPVKVSMTDLGANIANSKEAFEVKFEIILPNILE